MRATQKPPVLCPTLCWDPRQERKVHIDSKTYNIKNELFTAKLETSTDSKPDSNTFRDLVFRAVSEPGEVVWYGDFWVICTYKTYNEVQYYPTHRPIWMSIGQWEQLRATIRDYRLAYALEDKPLFMDEDEWTRILEIKARHGLLPDTKPQETMDEIEKKLDEQSLVG